MITDITEERRLKQRMHRPGGAVLWRPRGITLVELMVVLSIVAMMAGGGIYMVGLLTHGQLKDESMRLASVVKYTYNQAALNNRQYRLVIDLDSQEYYTEVTDSAVVVDARSSEAQEAFQEGMLPDELRRQEEEREQERSGMFREEEDDPFGMSRRTGFQRAEDAVVEARELRHNIEFEQVHVEGRSRPATSGRVAIHFFANGLQQQAQIVLRDPSSDAVYTLETEPLTGRVRIFSGEREVPEDFGQEEYDG